MGRPIYYWIIVFGNGETEIHEGETPSDALDYISYENQHNVVSIVNVGYYSR